MQESVFSHSLGSESLLRRYYSFDESTWDLVFFIGTGALGPLGSVQTFLLAVVNVVMQAHAVVEWQVFAMRCCDSDVANVAAEPSWWQICDSCPTRSHFSTFTCCFILHSYQLNHLNQKFDSLASVLDLDHPSHFFNPLSSKHWFLKIVPMAGGLCGHCILQLHDS